MSPHVCNRWCAEACRTCKAMTPEAELLRVNHRPIRVYESVAKIFETTLVSECRRLSSHCLQIFSNSEIFRVCFSRHCSNAEEVLHSSDLLKPSPVRVQKKREICGGFSGFLRVWVM